MQDIHIVGEYGNGDSAIDQIRESAADLVFLDIEMPPPGGFEIEHTLRDQPFQLIFTTAWEQYALRAFETRAIDYLLKPVCAVSVRRAIDKIRFQASFQASQQHPLNELDPLLVNDGVTTWRLVAADIAWIEALGRYRRIQLSETGVKRHGQPTMLTDATLEHCEQRLIQANFARAHRSYLVNCSQVLSLHSESRRHYLLLGPQRVQIPVARRQLGQLRLQLASE